MKPLLSLVLAILTVFGLTACAAAPTEPPCTEHRYTVTEKAVTPAFDGTKTYTCSVCGHWYTEVTEKADHSLKVLALGNSFSYGAMANLYNILTSGGIEDAVVANMYIGSCSVNMHWENLKNKRAAYQYQINTKTGWKFPDENGERLISIQEALTREDWDVITIQQASASSGKGGSHGKMKEIIDMLRPLIGEDTKIYWHQTWAYQQDSTHDAFPSYKNDQMTMYNAIMKSTEYVMKDERIVGLIPAGTAVQNARTSTVVGDTLTVDGYHLNRKGEFLAGLTWYAVLAGGDPDVPVWQPNDISDDELAVFREAAKNAVLKPYEVTPSIY